MTAIAARKPRMSRPQMRSGSLGLKPDHRFWTIKMVAGEFDEPPTAEVMVYGYIGQDTDPWTGERIGLSAQTFLEELREIPPASPVNIRINSRGGDVYDGTAIHAVLSAHKGKKTVYVDGIAASAASLIAMAGDEVVIPANAWMMIHDPATCVGGTAADLAEAIKNLESIKAGVVSAYAAKNKVKSEDEIAALMSATTWMTGAQAVENGFADRVSDAAPVTNFAAHADADVTLAAYENVPEELKAVESEPEPTVEPENPVIEEAKVELAVLVATLQAEVAELKAARLAPAPIVENVVVEPPKVELSAEQAEAARLDADARSALRREAVRVKLDARFDELAALGATTDQLRKLVIDGAVSMAALAPTSSFVEPEIPPARTAAPVKFQADAYYANINARPGRSN